MDDDRLKSILAFANQGAPDRYAERSFRTAGDSMNFDEFGEIVSVLWNEAHPDVPMYRAGAVLMDDLSYPCIVWKNGGRVAGPRTPLKQHRSVERFTTEDSDVVDVSIMEFVTNFLVEIADVDSKNVAKIAREFERFMFEFAGVLKYRGASEIVYDRQYTDEITKRGGTQVTVARIQYNMTEQMSFEVRRSLIKRVDLVL